MREAVIGEDNTDSSLLDKLNPKRPKCRLIVGQTMRASFLRRAVNARAGVTYAKSSSVVYPSSCLAEGSLTTSLV